MFRCAFCPNWATLTVHSVVIRRFYPKQPRRVWRLDLCDDHILPGVRELEAADSARRTISLQRALDRAIQRGQLLHLAGFQRRPT